MQWKSGLLGSLLAVGAGRLASCHLAGELAILCYHGIWMLDEPNFGNYLFMHPDRFASRMALLRKHRFAVLDLDEALSLLESGRLPRRAVAITIDDGWYGSYVNMLPVLESLQLPATLYAYTSRMARRGPVPNVVLTYLLHRTPRDSVTAHELELDVDREYDLRAPAGAAAFTNSALELINESRSNEAAAELAAINRIAQVLQVDLSAAHARRAFELMTPQELQDAARRGLRIELHTHDHEFPADGEVASAAIQNNRDVLQRWLGGHYQHFCYPSGLFQRPHLPILESLGVRSATTCEIGFASVKTPRLLLPRILDGDQVSDAEFLSELYGVLEVKRRIQRHLNLSASTGLSA